MTSLDWGAVEIREREQHWIVVVYENCTIVLTLLVGLLYTPLAARRVGAAHDETDR